MSAQDSPEILPEGWTVQFIALKTGRKVKHYVNSATGQNFFLKDDLMRHIKARNLQLGQPQLTNSPIKRPSKYKPMHLVEYTNENSEWLPHGWIMESKTRNNGSRKGESYKCYVNTSNGHKCYSKPELFRYLKEMKIARDVNGTRKNMPSSAAKSRKLDHLVTRSQLVGGSKSSDLSSISSLGAYSLRNRGGKPSLSSLAALPAAPTIGTSSPKSSRDDRTESKENSDVNQSLLIKVEDVSSDGGLGTVFPEADDRKEQNSLQIEAKSDESCRRKTQKKLSESQNEVNLPRRYSKRLAGIEPEMVTTSSGIKDVGSCKIETQSCLSESNSKKVPELACRCSKRLAEVEPEPVSNLGFHPLIMKKTNRPAKGEVALAVDLTKSVLVDEESKEIQCQPRKELLLHSSDDDNHPLIGVEPESVVHAPAKGETPLDVAAEASNQTTEPRKELLLHTSCDANNLLLGVEPWPAANSMSIVQALPKTIRPALAVGLNNRGLAAKASKKTHSALRKQLFNDSNSLFFGEPTTESQRYDSFWLREDKASPGRSDKFWLTEAEASLGRSDTFSLTEVKASRGRADTFWLTEAKADIKQEQNCLTSGKKVGCRKNEKNPEASSMKKGLNFPRQSSKRVVGFGTELVANSVSGAEALQKSEVSQRNETILAVGLIPNGSTDPRLELPHHTLSNVKNSRWGKKSNKPEVKTNDKKSEPQTIPPLGEFMSDPCLEFAYKTLTGDLPVEISPDKGLPSTPAADVIGEQKLTAIKIEKRSYRKRQVTSKKSKTAKKLTLFHQASEFQPDLIIKNSAFKNTARMSSESGAALNVGRTPECEKKRDKPEQPPFFSFADYWSDPCFEFAFKTLTGAIPVEDSLQNQTYFQQEVNTTQTQQHFDISQTVKDVSSSLPDFGLPSFFQTDISVHFDPPPEKRPPQMPMNSLTFPSSGNAPAQPPQVKENKGLRGKVNS